MCFVCGKKENLSLSLCRDLQGAETLMGEAGQVGSDIYDVISRGGGQTAKAPCPHLKLPCLQPAPGRRREENAG